MTAKSSKDEATSKRTIKATSGAWWNTKVEEETEKKTVVVEKKAKKVEEKIEPISEDAPKPTKPRRPRKKPQAEVKVTTKPQESDSKVPKPENKKPNSRVKAEKAKTVSDSELAASRDEKKAPESPEKPTTPKVVKPRQPRQRRRPNRSSDPKKSDSENENVKVEAEQKVTPVVSQDQITKSEENKKEGEVQVEDTQQKPPRRRSRSGRKPKVKVEAEQVQAETKERVAVVHSENVDDKDKAIDGSTNDVQENAEEAPKRTPRKRSRRSRKRRPEKIEDDSAATVNEEGVDAGVVNSEDLQEEVGAKESKWKNVPDDTKAKNIRLLINAEEPEECRLALLEDGRLQSLHVTTVARTQTKSNIYKAKVVAIEPNLQAAFVDYGTPKNGFLPFSEIHPEYYKTDLSGRTRDYVENRQWRKLKIEDVMERGQELLVQVVKEEVGKKGANMTTYLSLPGRCTVLMPGSDSAGISRKISGEERRGQLRDIMRGLEIPEGIGWIVRTASVDITEAALERDVTYLLKLWEEIRAKGQSIENVGLAYEDQRSVLRFLREHFDPSIQEILVDAQAALDQVNEFVSMLPVKQQNVKVRLHKGSRPIFNQFSVEDQIESIYQPHVNLPSGGSIVIDPTEALVAIDVNSGSTSKGKNFEESIFQANMEAASELARQLRLRDLGGLVVVDFIDMRNKKHIREVEREVKVSMKRDKAKVDFSRISKFGLMQISRQKLGSPLEAGTYRVCTHCKGRGTVRAVETLALFYLRRIQTGASRNPVMKVECRFPLDVAAYLLNNKRQELSDLEGKYNVDIIIIADTTFRPAENEIVFHRQEKEKNDEK